MNKNVILMQKRCFEADGNKIAKYINMGKRRLLVEEVVKW